jgi:phosphoglycolate phosphatase
MSAIKHIFFDWNSTLLDDFPIICDCMNLVMRRCGMAQLDIEQFRACYEVPFEKLYANLGFPEGDVPAVMKENRDIFHNAYEPRAITAPLREGAVEILAHAQGEGIRTYILSNHIIERIRVQLRRLDIEHHFTDVLAYATLATQFVGMTKGDILEQYIKEKALRPGEAMIVGDSIEEIEIGHKHGLISVGITGGGALETKLRAAKADYVIHSLHELLPILKAKEAA